MTRQEQEAIERLKEHISAILLYVAEAKLDKEEVENELLNIEALVVAIEAIESKSKLESATTMDEKGENNA